MPGNVPSGFGPETAGGDACREASATTSVKGASTRCRVGTSRRDPGLPIRVPPDALRA